MRDEDSILSFLRVFDEYSGLSGAQLNPGKSRALLFGALTGAHIGGIPVAPEVRVLGVNFTSRGVSTTIWEEICSQVGAAAETASRFNLPLPERAFIIKTVLLAKLFFAARVALPPRQLITRVTRSVHTFFWGSRTELVKRRSLQLPPNSGGWSLPCVTTMCQVLACRTVLDILDDAEHPARLLALYFLGPRRRQLAPRGLGDSSPSSEFMPRFYVQICTVDNEVKDFFPGRDVRDSPPSRAAEGLTAARHAAPTHSTSFPWRRLVASDLPAKVRDLYCQGSAKQSIKHFVGAA